MKRLLITLSLISLYFSISAQNYDECSCGIVNGVKWSNANDGTYEPDEKGIKYTYNEAIYFANISNTGWRLPTFIELKRLVAAEFHYQYRDPYTGKTRECRIINCNLPNDIRNHCWNEHGNSGPYCIYLPATALGIGRYYATNEYGVITLYEFDMEYADSIEESESSSGCIRLVKIE